VLDGRLTKEAGIGFDQVTKRIARSHIDLKNAIIILESDEIGAFRMAYDAMLRAGISLILSFGYRPKVKNFHKTVVETVRFILGDDFGVLLKKFDQMRKGRYDAIYDISNVSRVEAEESIKTARELIEQIENNIKERNPQKELL
jgi:uncharacterized protein (UPF0332 family)